ILLAASLSFFGTGSIAKQALERHARVDLGRQGLHRRSPGNGICVRATITPVAITVIAIFFDRKLNGFQDSIAAIFLRDQLIDSYAKIGAYGIPARAHTRKQNGSACMVAPR